MVADERPLLTNFFIAVLGVAREGDEEYEASTVATSGAFLYSSAATLGMAKSEVGDTLATLIWGSDLSGLWSAARATVARRDAEFSSLQGVGLARYFLETEFPLLWSEAAIDAAVANPSEAEQLAREQVRLDKAWQLWAGHIVGGLAFGILEPNRVRAMLAIDHASRDPSSDPADLTLDEEVERIVGEARVFVEAFYPELAQPLGFS